MFVTVVYAVYDPATGQLTYANGGHNPPLIVHADGSSTVLPPTGGVALGVMPGLDYQQKTVTSGPGDAFVFYTDGVTEAMNEAGEEFGLDRLREVFLASPPQDSEKTNRDIIDAVHAFAGNAPQSDDITCLTLHRSGAAV
jgi:sigma-B regulation protein RsbU (phosphoserine phosphatase)